MKSPSTSARLTVTFLLAVGASLTTNEAYSQVQPPREPSFRLSREPLKAVDLTERNRGTDHRQPLVGDPINAKPYLSRFRDENSLRMGLAELPLCFVENRGQMDPRVAFQIQGRNTVAYFTARGLTLVIAQSLSDRADGSLSYSKTASAGAAKRWNVKLDFIGANPDVRPVGKERTQAQIGYFHGPAKEWRTGIRTYSSVVYSNLWPGIDLVYSGTVNRLKYEFIVHPGAHPEQIRLAYRGTDAPLIYKSRAGPRQLRQITTW